MDKVLTFSQYRSPNTDQTPVWAASRAQCGLPASFGSSRGLGAPTRVCQVIPAALAHPTGTHASHLRGQPSSWSWDLSLAGTKSKYQVGPLPVPGFLPPLILPKTMAHPTLLVLSTGRVGLTQSRNFKTGQAVSANPPIWQMEKLRPPGEWQSLNRPRAPH